MPRDGQNIYSKPGGTTAVTGTTIESARYNQLVDDLVTDANTPRPIVAGGTGATTPGAARAAFNLGTLSTQAANSVAITGGSINGTNIGDTTPAAGAFTTINATGSIRATAAVPVFELAETDAGNATHNRNRISRDANILRISTVADNGANVSNDYEMTMNASGATGHSFQVAGTERLSVVAGGITSNGTTAHSLRIAGTERLGVENSGVRLVGNITLQGSTFPSVTNSWDVGSGSLRIRTIFLLDAPNVSSDARLKENIEYLTLHERRAAANIRARTFNMIEGGQKKVGYIAQEVIEAMASEGLCAFEYGLVTDGERYGVDMDAINAFRLG